MQKEKAAPRVTKSVSMTLELAEKCDDLRHETRETLSSFIQSALRIYIRLIEEKGSRQ